MLNVGPFCMFQLETKLNNLVTIIVVYLFVIIAKFEIAAPICNKSVPFVIILPRFVVTVEPMCINKKMPRFTLFLTGFVIKMTTIWQITFGDGLICVFQFFLVKLLSLGVTLVYDCFLGKDLYIIHFQND